MDRRMFNREYQRRAARQALARIGAIVERDPNSGFYRPAVRPDPRPEHKKKSCKQHKKAGEQLELFAPASPAIVTTVTRDPDRPLADIFPEAYEK